MATLRHETHSLHARLEALLGLPTSIRSADEYRQLLQQFYGFYRPIECRLAHVGRWHTVGIDLAGRRKLPLLAADLARLGVSLQGRRALPRADLPPFPSRAAAFGGLYVLEGATLGGRIVGPALAPLGADVARCTTFFASYGEATGAMWHQFNGALCRFAAAQPDEAEAVVQGARATFAAFAAWIESRQLR